MAKPGNLFYGFHGSIERETLNDILRDMDKIAEMPPQENMDLKKMFRKITLRLSPSRYLVRDIQRINPNGKEQVEYTCRFVDPKLEILEGGH